MVRIRIATLPRPHPAQRHVRLIRSIQDRDLFLVEGVAVVPLNGSTESVLQRLRHHLASLCDLDMQVMVAQQADANQWFVIQCSRPHDT